MANQQAPVVVIGASYAEGWKADSLAGLPVVNKGIDGQQSHEVLARFGEDVLQHQPKPAAVIIWGFINDIHRGDREDIDRIVARAKDNLRNMVMQARASGITPVLVTELTVRGPKTLKQDLMHFVGDMLGKESYQDYVNARVLEVNDWMRQYAASKNVLVLDFQPLLADDDGRRARAYAVQDGSHISEAGYRKLTEYARDKLPAGVFEEVEQEARPRPWGQAYAAR